MSLRVVHVVCSDRFAGTERHVGTLAGAQAAAGHSVHVVGGDDALARLATEAVDQAVVRDGSLAHS